MRVKTKEISPESVGCKCYRPGDPEFDTLVNLVTPLHKIRTGYSAKQTMYHDNKPANGWKQQESISILYSSSLSRFIWIRDSWE